MLSQRRKEISSHEGSAALYLEHSRVTYVPLPFWKWKPGSVFGLVSTVCPFAGWAVHSTGRLFSTKLLGSRISGWTVDSPGVSFNRGSTPFTGRGEDMCTGGGGLHHDRGIGQSQMADRHMRSTGYICTCRGKGKHGEQGDINTGNMQRYV